LQADAATQAKEDAEAKTNPQREFDLLQRDAGPAAMHGQLKQARDLFQRVEEKAQGIDLKEAVVNPCRNKPMRSIKSAVRPALAPRENLNGIV